MGCTSACMKCILNFFNTLFAITGVGLIAMGCFYLKSAPETYVYYLFIVGSFNLLAAFFGCCGVCRENVCMTATYAVLILCSLIAQIYNKVKPTSLDEVKKLARDDILKIWEKEIRQPGAMDTTQQLYKCCGLESGSSYYGIGRLVVPASCYPDNVINQATGSYPTGCIKAVEENMVKIFSYGVSGEWGVIAVTTIMVIFAVYLVFRFRNKQNRYRY